MADPAVLTNPITERPPSWASWQKGSIRRFGASQATGIRLVKGVGWTAFGGVVSQGSSFLSSVILARLLGREVFGQFAMIQSTVIALTSLAGLGLGATATKFVSEYRTSDPQKAGRILGLSSLVAMAAAVLSALGLFAAVRGLPFIAEGHDLIWCVRTSTLYVFFITLSGYQLGALVGMESFRQIATINTIYGVSTLILSIVLTLSFSIRGAVLAQAAGAALLWSLLQWRLVRECATRGIAVHYRGAWQERSVLVGFSIPAAACSIVGALAMWGCNAILVRSSGYAELAVFTAANSVRSMVLFVPALVARVTAPLLNHLRASGEFVDFRRTFWRVVVCNGVAAALAAVSLSACGPTVLHWFGNGFTGASWVMIVLLASVVLEVISNNLYQVLFASGRLWLHLAFLCIWAGLLIVAAMVATPARGAAGIAFAYLIAWGFATVLYGAAARRQCLTEGATR